MARLTADNVRRAEAIIVRYPHSRSALIPLLHLAQEQDGFLAEDAMNHIAELLGIAAAEVLGTASFYEMFKREPTGRYLIGICTNISCLINGADSLLDHAERTLGIKAGSTTPDGMFTLEGMECLAACGGAPCVQANYRYFENVTPEAFDRLIDDLRGGRLDVPAHGTLSRIAANLPVPQTDPARTLPEEIH